MPSNTNIVGTSTDPRRRARLAASGADIALDTNTPGWAEQVLQHTGDVGADVAIDFLSGCTVNQTMAATRLGGRLVNVGRLAGATAPFDFDLQARRRISYIGVTFRTRSPQEVRDLVVRARRDLSPGLDQGRFRLPIDQVFPLARIAEANARMKSDRHFGKIVLTTN